MQQIAALALGHLKFARAHIRHGQSPAGPIAPGAQHHGAEPVVAPGEEHFVFQHRAGGEHPGDAPLEQFALGGPLRRCRLELVAEGHAQAAAHQLGAIALGGVVGNARHRHPADGLAGFLAGQGELEEPGEGNGVFKEAFEKVAQAIEQYPLGMGGLELHVVAQHRRELLRVHQAVVVPGGQIGAGVLACCCAGWVLVCRWAGPRGGLALAWLVCCPGLPLPWPAAGIGGQGCFIEIAQGLERGGSGFGLGWGLELGRFRLAKQTSLEGQLRLLLGWRGHGWGASRG